MYKYRVSFDVIFEGCEKPPSKDDIADSVIDFIDFPGFGCTATTTKLVSVEELGVIKVEEIGDKIYRMTIQ